jgi:hypothetical protein
MGGMPDDALTVLMCLGDLPPAGRLQFLKELLEYEDPETGEPMPLISRETFVRLINGSAL